MFDRRNLTALLVAITLVVGQGLARDSERPDDYEADYHAALQLIHGDLSPRKAARILKRAASNGHAKSQNLLALLYLEGRGVPQNERLSVHWFEEAAEARYGPAMYNLGYAYANARGTDRDFEKAYQWLIGVADPDKPLSVSPEEFALFKEVKAAACYQIGLMYASGLHVGKSVESAAKWMERSATGGNFNATLYMASAYALGTGVQRDIQRSNEFLQLMALGAQDSFRKALSRYYYEDADGDIDEQIATLAKSFDDELKDRVVQKQLEIANNFLQPNFPEYNPEEGLKWLRLAVRSGNVQAVCHLASAVYRGIGGDPDPQEAYRLYASQSDESPIAAYNRAALLSADPSLDSEHADFRPWLEYAAASGLYVARVALRSIGPIKQLEDSEAYRACVAASASGDPVAQYCLGRRYLSGTGVPQNTGKALELYGLSAESGYADGQYGLGSLYAMGVFSKPDHKAARQWFERSAAQGHPESLFRLGLMYETGDHVEADLQRAFNYYRQAAETGHRSAQNNLGVLCWTEGSPFYNEAEAVRYLRLAAAQDDPVALFNLGVELLRGQRLNSDPNESLTMLKRSAEQGYMNAQLALGKLYEHGHNVTKSLTTAASWYEQAASQGSYEAQMRIAAFYRDGSGVAANRAKALFWFMEAGQSSSLEARFESAKLMREPDWAGYDPEEAAAVFETLADADYIPAELALGEMREKGIGVPKNLRKAFASYRTCSKDRSLNFTADHTEALYRMGRCYANGIGVRQSDSKAAHSFQEAARRGHTQAQFELAQRYFSGSGVVQNLAEGVKWLRYAADNRHVAAMEQLGLAYVEGDAGAPERDQAIDYLKQAATAGSRKALEGLEELGVEFSEPSPSEDAPADMSSPPEVPIEGLDLAQRPPIHYLTAVASRPFA